MKTELQFLDYIERQIISAGEKIYTAWLKQEISFRKSELETNSIPNSPNESSQLASDTSRAKQGKTGSEQQGFLNNKPVVFPADIIQIATESMKGCGKMYLEYNLHLLCGQSNCICPKCLIKIQTHKQDWKGELVKFKSLRNGLAYRICEYCNFVAKEIEHHITELTQALKILEGGK